MRSRSLSVRAFQIHTPKPRSIQALALGAALAAPLWFSAPAQAQFNDIPPGYWASDYIQALSELEIITGFPDGSFQAEQPVTRAQYAAMVRKAFPRVATVRSYQPFSDVNANFWAAPAIATAYSSGFMSGYPGNEFRANENIPRVQVLVSLANGLGYEPQGAIADRLSLFQDAAAIPSYASRSIAAASDNNLVVNYPIVNQLNPNRSATRGEVAAFIYQALSNQSQVTALSSPYVARLASLPPANTPITNAPVEIPAGTSLTVRYEAAEKIYVAPNEPNPVPVTLTTAQAIQTSAGGLLVPVGSEVVGVLESDDNGAQFIAQQLKLASGETYALAATSQVITTTEVIREGASAGRIVRDAAIGAGAAAVISGVTGDRKIEAIEVLGGVGAGAIFGVFNGRKQAELFVIDPEVDLTLTLIDEIALPIR